MLSNVTEKQTNKHGVRCDYIQYLLKLDLHFLREQYIQGSKRTVGV